MNGFWARSLLTTGGIALAVLLFIAPRVPSDPSPSTEGKEPSGQLDSEIEGALNKVRNRKMPMKGIMELRELANEHPEDPRPQWHLGLLSMRTGQYDKAIQRFEKVIALDDDGYPEAYFYLGRALSFKGQTKTARQHLRRYLEEGKDKEKRNKAKRLLESKTPIDTNEVKSIP